MQKPVKPTLSLARVYKHTPWGPPLSNYLCCLNCYAHLLSYIPNGARQLARSITPARQLILVRNQCRSRSCSTCCIHLYISHIHNTPVTDCRAIVSRPRHRTCSYLTQFRQWLVVKVLIYRLAISIFTAKSLIIPFNVEKLFVITFHVERLVSRIGLLVSDSPQHWIDATDSNSCTLARPDTILVQPVNGCGSGWSSNTDKEVVTINGRTAKPASDKIVIPIICLSSFTQKHENLSKR